MRFKYCIAAPWFIVIMIFLLGTALADDLVVTGTITDTQDYSSDERLILDHTLLEPTARVTTIATYETILTPGTHIKAGATLLIRNRDNDGLSNYCEMYYFGDLSHNPGDDYDQDLLLNVEECILGTNPAVYDLDNDDDGIEDWWEIKYAGLDLNAMDRNGDGDGDGVANWIEFKLNTDPTTGDLPGPGVHYEYDDLGRITRILRIPGE